MGVWNELIAVNRCLRAGGENPVNTLNSTSGDALAAKAILDEVNYEVQASGLAVNTEEVDLVADASGNIEVADEVLHVQPLETPLMVVARGREPCRLYNVTDNTYNFTAQGTIRCRLVTGMLYDDLDFAHQVAIADEAAVRYQQLVAGDPGANQMLRELWMQSRAKARAQDIRSRNVGIFSRWGSSLPWRAAKQTNRGNWSQ